MIPGLAVLTCARLRDKSQIKHAISVQDRLRNKSTAGQAQKRSRSDGAKCTQGNITASYASTQHNRNQHNRTYACHPHPL